MAPWWWSWLLMVVGVTGLWLAGRRSAWGWAVGIGAQVLWAAYAISTRQWGFLASCAAYGWVHATNFRRWRQDAAAVEQETPVPSGTGEQRKVENEMGKDKSKIVMDREGNSAVYDSDGVLSRVVVDGKVRNVSVPKQDRDAIRRRK